MLRKGLFLPKFRHRTPPNQAYLYEKRTEIVVISVLRTPSGARTLDPNIKSVVLYQLS